MITGRELTLAEKEALATEVRQFLIDNELWSATRIYWGGKAFCAEKGILEDANPRNYFEYVSDDDIMSMSFEGDFYGRLNYRNDYGADFDNRIQEEFNAILKKYGVYYELGHAWNLSCYYSWR
jgi:hypothetical protein